MDNLYPENKAVRIAWDEEQEVTKTLVYTSANHYCGYVRFKTRPVIEEGYGGILIHVPVHGGITYANEDEQGMVYGFDCAHIGDETNLQLQDETFLLEECRRLALAIRIAAKWEPAYLSYSPSEAWRAHVVQGYLDRLKQFGIEQESFNFGQILTILCGHL